MRAPSQEPGSSSSSSGASLAASSGASRVAPLRSELRAALDGVSFFVPRVLPFPGVPSCCSACFASIASSAVETLAGTPVPGFKTWYPRDSTAAARATTERRSRLTTAIADSMSSPLKAPSPSAAASDCFPLDASAVAAGLLLSTGCTNTSLAAREAGVVTAVAVAVGCAVGLGTAVLT